MQFLLSSHRLRRLLNSATATPSTLTPLLGRRAEARVCFPPRCCKPGIKGIPREPTNYPWRGRFPRSPISTALLGGPLWSGNDLLACATESSFRPTWLLRNCMFSHTYVVHLLHRMTRNCSHSMRLIRCADRSVNVRLTFCYLNSFVKRPSILPMPRRLCFRQRYLVSFFQLAGLPKNY